MIGEKIPPLLDVRALRVEFRAPMGTVNAVAGVDFELRRGETLAILGESGSGKSVTAASIMGLVPARPGISSSGSIRLDGVDLLGLSAEERRRINGRRIGMIFQDPLAALNPVYTVGWQVAETFSAHGVARDTARAKAVQLLGRVGIPDHVARAGDYPHQFSGGQRQRIMIAMAIGMKPDLLIADEPTSALDVTVQTQILDLLKELQRETGMGMMLITHDFGVVARIADRVAVMRRGEIVETNTVDGLFSRPQHAYTRSLIEAIPGRGRIKVRPQPAAAELIALDGVSVIYPTRGRQGTPALDGVSFTMKRGETLGIVGKSGSGKSTLAKVLLALQRPNFGSVRMFGADLYAMKSAALRALRRNVQVVFQDPTSSLNPRMTVAQIVSEPWYVHPDVVPTEARESHMLELLRRVGLDAHHALRYRHQLSGGQRQRVAIARALALRPELIICDEAVSALDVSVQAQVMTLLKELRCDLGLSFIFISHDLNVVRDFVDRLIIMKHGRIVEEGSTKVIFDSPKTEYTASLIGSMMHTGRMLPAHAAATEEG